MREDNRKKERKSLKRFVEMWTYRFRNANTAHFQMKCIRNTIWNWCEIEINTQQTTHPKIFARQSVQSGELNSCFHTSFKMSRCDLWMLTQTMWGIIMTFAIWYSSFRTFAYNDQTYRKRKKEGEKSERTRIRSKPSYTHSHTGQNADTLNNWFQFKNHSTTSSSSSSIRNNNK